MIVFVLAYVSALVALTTSTPLKRADQCEDPEPFPGFPNGPGFVVQFRNPDKWTIEDHFKEIGKTFEAEPISFVGYYGPKLTKADLRTVCQDREVINVEHNAIGEFEDLAASNSTTLPVSVPALDNGQLQSRATTPNVGWGLTYLSEKEKRPVNDEYQYLANSGEGVDLYILDTGINKISPFGVRVVWERDYSGDGFPDQLNHGTFVASLAGSDKYGSAKMPNLYSYKIDDKGDPSAAYVYRALGDLINANARRKSRPGYKGAVINMSLGLPSSVALQTLIVEANSRDISFVVAAGNSGLDTTDPQESGLCRYPQVICVGSIDRNYALSSFSNYGRHISVFAPGDQVMGYNKDGIATDNRFGTSLSAPYVSGIVATYYGYEGSNMNPIRAKTLLLENADKNYLSGLKGGSKNLLANNGYQKGPPGRPYNGAPGNAATGSQNTCAVKYKFLSDSFIIEGINFDPAKLGANGSELKKQISDCHGDLTEWDFNLTPGDPDGYQWKATGRTIVGKKDCIGKAVVYAGGDTVGACKGSGL